MTNLLHLPDYSTRRSLYNKNVMAAAYSVDRPQIVAGRDFSNAEPSATRLAIERASLDQRARVDRLRTSALFAGLSWQECSEALAFARKRTYGREDVLFHQGNANDCWMFIETGSIKLTQLTADGNEFILSINGCTEAVGVQSDVLGEVLTCSARAISRCDILAWDRMGIQTILGRYPQVRRNITAILAARLRDMEERLREFAAESVPNRLALALLRLAKPIGRRGESGFALHLRRQDLAQMTGTTLFTVSRILSKWTGEGVLVARREEISFRDPALLLANTTRNRRSPGRTRNALLDS
jgi:CRP-like cAMP-binding protein